MSDATTARPELLRNDRRVGGPSLKERVLYLPRMSSGAARCISAALRGYGIDARPLPPSDARTLEYGGRFTSGDECYPEVLTLGDIMKVVLDSGERPERLAFFMPAAPGPCRYGQYTPFLRRTLDAVGATEVMVVSPSSGSGYDELGQGDPGVHRAGWRGLVAADGLRRTLLRVRPYETSAGAADEAYEDGLVALEALLERPGISPRAALGDLRSALAKSAARFAAIPRRDEVRVLVGVVGEIYCRLNTFSNDEMIRTLERLGGEAWLSDISEWVFYTNIEQRRKWLPYAGEKYSLHMAKAWLKDTIQRRDEHALLSPLHDLLHDRAEPKHISVVTDLAEPYLPAEGVYGEMVMNAGKAIWLWSQGCDGIIDISPFTCMNGIVCEAIYPKLSRDHDGIPIRTFYFDGTASHVDRDLGIFLELASSYQKRKRQPRS
jgi:predicted nucleotide-binding protein (sugar kinase/HSP70/actin superfamily)